MAFFSCMKLVCGLVRAFGDQEPGPLRLYQQYPWHRAGKNGHQRVVGLKARTDKGLIGLYMIKQSARVRQNKKTGQHIREI